MKNERVIPGKTNVFNLMKHIVRYNISLMFAKNKDVLDLSCGTGYGSFMLSMVARTVLGVDISKEAINFANNHYKANNLIFKKLDILKLNIQPVDLIISFETIEHVKDLDKLQHVFTKLLKKGGQIVYSVPIREVCSNPYHLHKFDFKKAMGLFNKFNYLTHSWQTGLVLTSKEVPSNEPNYLIIAKQKV